MEETGPANTSGQTDAGDEQEIISTLFLESPEQRNSTLTNSPITTPMTESSLFLGSSVLSSATFNRRRPATASLPAVDTATTAAIALTTPTVSEAKNKVAATSSVSTLAEQVATAVTNDDTNDLDSPTATTTEQLESPSE